jgi:exodeoxyribonuclease-3
MSIKIVSWNVNGVRAVFRKGFMEWLKRESPDILCAQEVKVQPDQLGKDLREPEGYHAYWDWGEKKGYSGVATLSQEEPLRVRRGFGMEDFDKEGRVIIAQYPDFTLFNVYFPNGKASEERLKYKLEFYDAFLDFVDPLQRTGYKLIVCGDFNTAHHEIDLARPRENEKVSGFLPIERAWMDRFEEHGFVDSFRQFNEKPGQYTWWDLKSGARERNVGWRLDYFYVSSDLMPSVSRAFIMQEVMGSDHCPIGIELNL